MKTYKISTIYHAAAYKHVPLVEHNIIEGIRNNIFGTLNAALAALNEDVETFVLISTDKAVRPTNIMGASKRFAELILQALAFKQNENPDNIDENVFSSSGNSENNNINKKYNSAWFDLVMYLDRRVL